MTPRSRIASLFDTFQVSMVGEVVCKVRRAPRGGYEVYVACSSVDDRSFSHTRLINTYDGDPDVVLDQLVREAVGIVTGATVAEEEIQEPPRTVEKPVSNVAARLSEREREVLRLIAEGNNNKTIGMKLGISVHTVNTHRMKLMNKIDAHDVVELTRFAIKHGIIDAHHPRATRQ